MFAEPSLVLSQFAVYCRCHTLQDDSVQHLQREVYPYVKFKYIFQFLTATLPIHYVTFIELR